MCYLMAIVCLYLEKKNIREVFIFQQAHHIDIILSPTSPVSITVSLQSRHSHDTS